MENTDISIEKSNKKIKILTIVFIVIALSLIYNLAILMTHLLDFIGIKIAY